MMTASWEMLANRANERAERLEQDAHRIDVGWKAELAMLRDQNERDKAQRDSLKEQMQEWMEGSAQLQVKLDEAASHLRVLQDELGTLDCDIGENCGRCIQCKAAMFLAGLSTVTPEEDCTCNRDPEDGGHTPDCNRMKPNQTCERVSVRPHTPGDETDHICATHHGPWPSDTKRCPASLAGNTTT